VKPGRARVGGALVIFLLPGILRASDAGPCDLVPAPATQAAPAPPSIPAVVGTALLEETKRYLKDGAALVTSPLHWDDRDWAMFGAYAVSLGVLLATDQQTYVAIQERRSATTDDISDVTTPFGQPYAWGIAGGMLAAGLIAGKPGLRDTGRDAVEAAVFAGLITTILKPVFGRERPEQSGGRTIFHGFTSKYESFPSGHATIAWAVASVVAMRTDGWIVPTVAYTLATLVAFDRVNDEKHFIADVFTGAAIGVAVGRFVVGRHREAGRGEPGVAVSLVPIPGGIGARLTF
jgi:membrane-associated phospholipid phosphatase